MNSHVVAWDLPGAHVALVLSDFAAALRKERRHCAAALATSGATAETWQLIVADCEGLGPTPRSRYSREVLTEAARRLATGRAGAALGAFADHCGLSEDDYCREVRLAMDTGVSS